MVQVWISVLCIVKNLKRGLFTSTSYEAGLSSLEKIAKYAQLPEYMIIYVLFYKFNFSKPLQDKSTILKGSVQLSHIIKSNTICILSFVLEVLADLWSDPNG